MGNENWKTYKLGDITTWKSGGTPTKSNPKFWNGDIPWISAKTLTGRYVSDSPLKITKAALTKGGRIAPKGSLLFLVRGSGLYNDIPVAMATKELAYNQDIKSVKPNFDGLNNDFLLYWFKGNKQTFTNLLEATSIGAGKFDSDRLFDLNVQLPSLSEQKAISSILSALDDKIENNLAMNKTLEDMAMALYKHWFVDFGPFQDSKFIDSELGLIPEGWEVKRLTEISMNHNKKRKPLSTRVRAEMQGKYPYYGATKALDFINDFRFDGEFILLAEDGTVKTDRGTPFLQFVEGQFWVSNHAHVLTGNDLYSNEFVYLSLANSNVIPIITGAVQLKINKQNLESLTFITPSTEILRDFETQVIHWFKQIRLNILETETLTKLRDTLLPKLILGEVRVKDVEQIVNEVL